MVRFGKGRVRWDMWCEGSVLFRKVFGFVEWGLVGVWLFMV